KQKGHLLSRIQTLVQENIARHFNFVGDEEKKQFAVVHAFLCTKLTLPQEVEQALRKGTFCSEMHLYTDNDGPEDVDSEIQSVIQCLENVKKLDPNAASPPPSIVSPIEDESDVDDSDLDPADEKLDDDDDDSDYQLKRSVEERPLLAPEAHEADQQHDPSTWSVAGVCRQIFDHLSSLEQWIAGSLRSIWTWMWE
ncbi:MAG: hypothetical protein WB791_07710, partial [Waddliaceae bacterium]